MGKRVGSMVAQSLRLAMPLDHLAWVKTPSVYDDKPCVHVHP